jgi:hypothetical protein
VVTLLFANAAGCRSGVCLRVEGSRNACSNTESKGSQLPPCSKQYFADQATETIFRRCRGRGIVPHCLDAGVSHDASVPSIHPASHESSYHHSQLGTLTYQPSPPLKRRLTGVKRFTTGTPRRQDLLLISLRHINIPGIASPGSATACTSTRGLCICRGLTATF